MDVGVCTGVADRVVEEKDWGRALLDGEGLTKVCGNPYLGKALSDDAAATTSALLDFFRNGNAEEKAREAMDLNNDDGGYLRMRVKCVLKELLDYRGVSSERNANINPSSAVVDRLGLQRLYRGMSMVAKEMLISIEAHTGAAPGSISGLMDVCDSGLTTDGSPTPASVLSIFKYHEHGYVSTSTDQEHVDRGLLTVVWSSRPGLQVYRAPEGGSDRDWEMADADLDLTRGEVVVFAGEALSVALGASMPFKAPVHRVRPDTSEPRISITFKARVSMSAVFKPPPCHGVAQPSLTAREWQQRTTLKGSVNRPMGHLVLPVNLEQCTSRSPPSLCPASSDTSSVLLERSAPCGLPSDVWELVLQNVPMLDHARSVQLVCRSWRDVSRDVACSSLDCTSTLQQLEHLRDAPYGLEYGKIHSQLMSDRLEWSNVLHLSFGMSAIKELRCVAGTGEILNNRGYMAKYPSLIHLPLPNQLQQIVIIVSPGTRMSFRHTLSLVTELQTGVQCILRGDHQQGGYDIINLAGTSLSRHDLRTLGNYLCQSHKSTSKGFKVDFSNNSLDDACVGPLVLFLQRNACIAEVRLSGNFFTAEDIAMLLVAAGACKVNILHDGQREISVQYVKLLVRGGMDAMDVQFKVKDTTEFHKIFDAYRSRTGIGDQPGSFVFDGLRIGGQYTPRCLECEDGDTIDFMHEVVGD